MIPLGEAHLRALLRQYVEHYHQERNHQGLGNVLPFPRGAPTVLTGVHRRDRLGGILGYYHREAP